MMQTYEAAIDSVLPTLIKVYGAELVILVGSAATGLSGPGSDIDLMAFAERHLVSPGTVKHFEHLSNKVAVEFYEWTWIENLLENGGIAAVRDLNRIRQARPIFDPNNRFNEVVPSRAQVRQALGPIDTYLDGIGGILQTSAASFQRSEFCAASLAAETASQAAAILYLSAGPGPLYYSKPKWIRSGILGTGNTRLVSSFDAAQNDLRGSSVKKMMAEHEQLRQAILAILGPERLKADRAIRRAIWLMEKHGRDAQSISLIDDGAVRSPCLVATSSGIESVCSMLGVPYTGILDFLTVREKLNANIVHRASEVLFPDGVPTKEISQKQCHASVEFVSMVSVLLHQDRD